MKKEYSDFLGRHKGQSVIVCGCGPSVKNLDNPEQYITVGVNDIGRLFTPDYLIVINSVASFKNGRGDFVRNTTAPVVFSQYPELAIERKQHVVPIRFERRNVLNLDNTENLSFSNNSPYVGAIIAYHLGASRIGMIGVDFTEHHFFSETGVHKLNRSMQKIREDYGNLHAEFKNRNVEFFNLSEHSNVDTVPFMPLDQFTGQKKMVSE